MAYTTINKSTDHFNTKLYTGNGSTQSITGVGFQPDWTWIKDRSAAQNHMLFDAVRGVTKWLESNGTAAEQTYAPTLTAFDSDGFSLGNSGDVNGNSATFASWNWKANGAGSTNYNGSINSTVSANTTAGFSIVSYTGTGSNATVGHGLSQEPDILIIKNRSVSNRWVVYTKLIDGTFDFLQLNTSDAKTNSSVTPFTSSVFSVINNADSGTSGNNYIAYAFHSVKAYSKMGIYTGNGNADGTFIYTGFKPAWVLIKAIERSAKWFLWDNKREPFNLMDSVMVPSTSEAENTDPSFYMDFLSNGFKLRNNFGDLNASGEKFIYMAFASAPLVGTNNIPATAR